MIVIEDQLDLKGELVTLTSVGLESQFHAFHHK